MTTADESSIFSGRMSFRVPGIMFVMTLLLLALVTALGNIVAHPALRDWGIV